MAGMAAAAVVVVAEAGAGARGGADGRAVREGARGREALEEAAGEARLNRGIPCDTFIRERTVPSSLDVVMVSTWSEGSLGVSQSKYERRTQTYSTNFQTLKIPMQRFPPTDTKVSFRYPSHYKY